MPYPFVTPEIWDLVDGDNKIIGNCLVEYYDNLSLFPATGKVGVYYLDESTGVWYVWDGSAYAVYNDFVGHRPVRP